MDDKTKNAEEELQRLLQSRYIADVYLQRLSPQMLDQQIRGMKADNADLKRQLQTERAENTRLRRALAAARGEE